MFPWQPITFIGDSIVTLPIAAAIAIWLLAAGAWRAALAWCVMFGSSLTLVAATKIAFIGWGIGIPGLDFTGISGHAMRACAVLPVAAYLLLRNAGMRLCVIGVLAALGAGILISLSRAVLEYHSASEVVTGMALGSLVATAFIHGFAGDPPLRLQRWVIGLTMLGLVPSAYAQPAPTHQWVTAVALYLSGHDRPYVRDANGRPARGPAIAETD